MSTDFYGAETSFSVCVLCRYQQSSKSSSHPSSLQPGTKSESLREEMEEAANRMEICRVRRQTRPPPLIYVPPAGFTHDGATMTGPRIRSDSFRMIYFLFQDQLSADMYSFVAKEIDYANYFQTVSALTLIRYCAFTGFDETVTCLPLVSPFLADRNAGRISQEVIRNPSQHPAPDQSPPR